MSMAIPFVKDFKFTYGVAEQVSPLIRRVIANNPGPFTYTGTGTYIIGHGETAVIDPGPTAPDHLAALQETLSGETVKAILITHTHRDHSAAAGALRDMTGAPVYAFGPHGGDREVETTLDEGADYDFEPDIPMRHGDRLHGPGWTVEAIHTPGHASNHLCFALRQEKALFTGDHVMGWATTVVAPPDGVMNDYFASLRMLLARDDKTYWPTHGAPITSPHDFVRAIQAHRQNRDAEILSHLADGHRRIMDFVPLMYTEVSPRLYPAAALSVYAHIVRHVENGTVTVDGEIALHGEFQLA